MIDVKNVRLEHMPLRRNLAALLSIACALSSGVSLADTRQQMDVIEVTGSRIPRAATEGVSPLVAFDRQALERSGASTLNEFIRDTVFSSAGVVDEQFTQGFAPGTSAINLRGLGVNRTLVLLDGKRLPVHPFGQNGTDSFVDINSIPLAAIERIEVVKDGASAIYGADAVAGVVNIITRKQNEGLEAVIKLGVSGESDGEEGELSLLAGKRWETTSASVSLSYFDRDAVMAADRKVTSSANGPIDDRSFLGQPGTIIPLATGLPQAAADCPSASLINRGPASFCGYDFPRWNTLVPETRRLGLVGDFEHELSESTHLFARAMYSHAYSERDLAPSNNAPDLFFVGAANPNNPLGENMVVLYRMEELGARRDEFETDTYNLLAGLKGYYGSWNWELSAGVGRVDSDTAGVNGYARAADLQSLVDSGALNLFGPSPDFDADAVSYVTRRDGRSKQAAVDFNAVGEVLNLSNGPVLVALGAELRREKLSDSFDSLTESGAILGVGGSSAEGDRSVRSMYVEFSIPAAAALELQVAGRIDNYSDFGTSFNPKLGLRWQLLPGLALRGSAGTGFKAPSLHELYSGEVLGFETVLDDGSLVGDVPTTMQGNPDLDAEESDSINLGLALGLSRHWTLGLDAWYLKNENAVTNDAQYIVDNEASYPGLVERNSSGDLVGLASPFLNIAAQKLWGLDLDSQLTWPETKFGDFQIALLASYLGAFEEERREGEGFEDSAGEDGRPEWRGNVSFNWSHAEFQGGLTVNHVGDYERAEVEDEIGSWTTVDSQFSWSPAGLSTTTFALGVENLFDREPPLDPYLEGWPFINRALHNARGRFWYLSYKQNF
ncbi:MAG: TonB-dependent receptor [Gammaproteobacteria bacterium]|nr:TonB-dependent receptor [Gammaproteobacteria bacterium]